MWLLKKTILFIGVILTAFVAALLSVISVLLDVPSGMFRGLDELSNVYTMSVTNTTGALQFEGGTQYAAVIDGITRYATLTGKTSSYNTSSHNVQREDDEPLTELVASLTISGYAVPLACAEVTFAPHLDARAQYNFPEHPGEITINPSIAKIIGAEIGDTITLSPDMFFHDPENGRDLTKVAPQTYTVVGFVDMSAMNKYNALNPKDYYLPSAHFFFIPEGDPTYSLLYYRFADSRMLYRAYVDMTRSGVVATMGYKVAGQIENITLAQAFFFAVTFVLGILVLFVLYSLIAIFYRQRKGMICRLKLLGARNTTIAGIYCIIAVLLVVVAVVFGALFSMAFNVYFMGLCGRLFKQFSANFVSRFRPIVPTAVFFGLAAFTVLLFFIVNRKVRNAAIAQEVRHE